MTYFNDVYNQYFRDAYKYVYAMCRNKAIAEDITQETFFKALKGIDSFNGKCKMRVWLCQIAKNTFFSYCEREKKLDVCSVEREWVDVENFEQKFLNTENAFEIHKALHCLNEPYKEVFTLRVFGELSFSQIDELFSKTESWARVTYHRAKAKLKEGLL